VFTKIVFIIAALVLSLALSFRIFSSSDSEKLSSAQQDFILEPLHALTHHHLPHLSNFEIQVRPLPQSSKYFFSTYVEKPWRSPAERIYVLLVHPEILNDPPEPKALQAILLHELIHFHDYHQMNLWQLAQLAWRYEVLEDFDFIAHYERHTDQRVIDRGLQDGLMLYRHWISRKLSEEDLANRCLKYICPATVGYQPP
jgi:hypothetical protein